MSSKSIGAIFPTAFAHFMSLCHILVILAVCQTLYQQRDYDLLKSQIMVSIFQQRGIFKLRYVHCFLDIILLHT